MSNPQHQDDHAQQKRDKSARKKDEEKRHEKVQEGNTTVDLPPGEEIPNAVGPTTRDADDEITP